MSNGKGEPIPGSPHSVISAFVGGQAASTSQFGFAQCHSSASFRHLPQRRHVALSDVLHGFRSGPEQVEPMNVVKCAMIRVRAVVAENRPAIQKDRIVAVEHQLNQGIITPPDPGRLADDAQALFHFDPDFARTLDGPGYDEVARLGANAYVH